MPGYRSSKALPIRSESLRSIEVYQTTLLSFLAASISAEVTAVAGGAVDSTWVEKAALAASAPEPTNRSRREILERFAMNPSQLLFVASPLARGTFPVAVAARPRCPARCYRPRR